MSDMSIKILNLLNGELTTNQICELLKISQKKLYYYLTLLRNYGYSFNTKYYYDGNMKLDLKYDTTSDDIAIITPHELEKTDFLIISDLHLSSEKERLDILDEAFNYCKKQDIHIILIPGDFIDGFIGNLAKKYNNSYEQIDYALKMYPFDKDILSFLVLGNHDYSALAYHGQNIKTVIENKRYDIVITGFGEGKINIKNDKIILRHPLKIVKDNNDTYNKTLIIKGHTHHSKTWTDFNNYIVYAPTLSNINNSEILPGMIHLTMDFYKGYIKRVYLRNLTYLNNKFYLTQETETYLINGKPIKNKQGILYEEPCKVLKK